MLTRRKHHRGQRRRYVEEELAEIPRLQMGTRICRDAGVLDSWLWGPDSKGYWGRWYVFCGSDGRVITVSQYQG